MELRELGAVLRRGWWLILGGIVLGLGGGGVLCLLLTPQYESTTQFFISAPDSQNAGSALQGSTLGIARAQSYVQVLTGPQLATIVIDQLGLDMTTDDFSDEIEAESDLTSVLVDVTVSDSSKSRALAIAQTINVEFPALVDQLETAGRGGESPVAAIVTGQPQKADSQSSPNVLLILLIGAAVGLVLGIGLAIARSRLDRSLKDPDETAQLAGAPIIGTILRDNKLQKRRVLSDDLTSAAGETFRQLRNNLQFLKVDEPPKVIMISSPVPSEGKTTVAINLGLALARTGRRVAIVDGDLRASRVSGYLGLVGGAGLTNVLAGTAEIDDVVQAYGDDGCTVLAAGPTPPNPGELLGSASMGALLDKLRSSNDFVIVDSAPLLAVADSTGLSTHVDGVLLVVHYAKTRKDQLRQASAALQRVGAELLGVVLNIVPPKAELARSFSYGYQYGGSDRTRRAKKKSARKRAERDAEPQSAT